MSTIIKNVIVAGGSGSAGKPIVAALLANKFSVSVLFRESSTTTFPTEVNVISTDYTYSSLLSAFKNQDAVVSTIPNTISARQSDFIDAAIAAGVKRFLPAEYGVDTQSPNILTVLPPLKNKIETLDYLKSKQDTGLSWSALIVGSFFDWAFSMPGFFGWNLPARTATLFDDGKPFEATNLAQIGRAVAAILSDEHIEQTKNQYVYVNSFTTTREEVVKGLEKVTSEKFEITRANLADIHRKSLEGKLVDTIMAVIYGVGDVNHYSVTRGLWNERLGLPKEDLEETLVKILTASKQ